MKVVAALLCDFASVREGLLNVLSGGITRLRRAELPAALNVSLALMVEVRPGEARVPHELAVVVQDEDGKRVAEVRGGFVVTPGAEVVPGETVLVPLALDLRPGAVDHFGGYSAEISLDGEHLHSLHFRVVGTGETGVPPRP